MKLREMTDIKKAPIESERVKMNLKEKKKATLAIYEKSMGNISYTCRQMHISRETFYRWCRKDEKFAQAVNEVPETNLDFAESALMKNIREGKEASIFFYLKTKGKNRGYIERQEFEHTIKDIVIEFKE